MITYTNPVNKARVDYHSSLPAFLDWIHPDGMPARTPMSDHRNEIEGCSMRDPRWSGDMTFVKAWEQCRWGVNIERGQLELRDRILTKVRLAVSPQAHWDVAGDCVDAGLYNTGVPECMLCHEERVGRRPKTVSILCNVAQNANITPKSIRLLGMAYLALVDALELSGQYRCAVYVMDGSRDIESGFFGRRGDKYYELIVRGKEVGSPYDPHALGFALCNAAFLRKLCFGACDRVMHESPKMEWLNHPTSHGITQLPKEIDDTVVDFSRVLHANLHTEADAQNWVIEQLRTFNVLEESNIL